MSESELELELGRYDVPAQQEGGIAKWFVGAAVIAAGVAQVGLFSSSILPLMPRFAGAPFVRMKSNVVDCLFDRALPRALAQRSHDSPPRPHRSGSGTAGLGGAHPADAAHKGRVLPLVH